MPLRPDGRPMLIAIIGSRPMERLALRHTILLGNLGETVEWPCQRAAEALAHLREFAPDAVILEAELDGRAGFALLRKIRRDFPELRCLFRLREEDAADIYAALEAGAHAIVFEHEEPGAHRETLRTLLIDGACLSPTVQRVLTRGSHPQRAGSKGARSLERLTPREREIHRMLGEGLKVGAIAARAGLSPKTIHAHIGRIARKLGVQGIDQLRHHAVLNRTPAPPPRAGRNKPQAAPAKARKQRV